VEPYFSICIPQYARTDFLLVALDSLARQSFRDFEICIADDCSPDGRQGEIEAWLKASGIPHVFRRNLRNLRYDGNLRTAIGLARGRYCFLLGNDDALSDSEVLGRLRTDMENLGPCAVAVTDFEDYMSGASAKRIVQTRNYGCGPAVAVAHFRNFSFVSGVVLERVAAQGLATAQWDGGEMYQTYLACGMIARGHSLLELAWPAIRKDVRIPGASVDSYATRPRVSAWPPVERRLPLCELGRIVSDAIAPLVPGAAERRRLNTRVLVQLLVFTYPFWLVEYRRVQSFGYALGFALAMRPAVTANGVDLGLISRIRVWGLYVAASLGGLLVPVSLFHRLQTTLYRVAKRPVKSTA
jgi:hypothetical protein